MKIPDTLLSYTTSSASAQAGLAQAASVNGLQSSTANASLPVAANFQTALGAFQSIDSSDVKHWSVSEPTQPLWGSARANLSQPGERSCPSIVKPAVNQLTAVPDAQAPAPARPEAAAASATDPTPQRQAASQPEIAVPIGTPGDHAMSPGADRAGRLAGASRRRDEGSRSAAAPTDASSPAPVAPLVPSQIFVPAIAPSPVTPTTTTMTAAVQEPRSTSNRGQADRFPAHLTRGKDPTLVNGNAETAGLPSRLQTSPGDVAGSPLAAETHDIGAAPSMPGGFAGLVAPGLATAGPQPDPQQPGTQQTGTQQLAQSIGRPQSTSQGDHPAPEKMPTKMEPADLQAVLEPATPPLAASPVTAKPAGPAVATSPGQVATSQVAPALVSLATRTDGSNELTVSMHPRDLGEVQIHMVRAPDGSVSVTVSATRPDTLQELSHNVQHLHAALDAADVPMDGRTMTFLAPSASDPGHPASESGSLGASSDRTPNPNPDQTPDRTPGQDRAWRRDQDGRRLANLADESDARSSAPIASTHRWQFSGLNITA